MGTVQNLYPVKEVTKMYTLKYQKMTRDGAKNSYIIEECEGFEDFIDSIVELAQTRGKGWKYRLMECNENSARFDIQYTKISE